MSSSFSGGGEKIYALQSIPLGGGAGAMGGMYPPQQMAPMNSQSQMPQQVAPLYPQMPPQQMAPYRAPMGGGCPPCPGMQSLGSTTAMPCGPAGAGGPITLVKAYEYQACELDIPDCNNGNSGCCGGDDDDECNPCKFSCCRCGSSSNPNMPPLPKIFMPPCLSNNMPPPPPPLPIPVCICNDACKKT